MKLAGIFQDLEHLGDFQTIVYGSHFVFHVQTHKQTHVCKALYNLPTMAFPFHGLSLHSEAMAPTIREK